MTKKDLRSKLKRTAHPKNSILVERMGKLRLVTPPAAAAARRRQQRQRPAEAEGAHYAIAQETRILRDKVVVREGVDDDGHVGYRGRHHSRRTE